MPCPPRQPKPAAGPMAGGERGAGLPAWVRAQGTPALLGTGTAAGGSRATGSEGLIVPVWFWRSEMGTGLLTPFSIPPRTQSHGAALQRPLGAGSTAACPTLTGAQTHPPNPPHQAVCSAGGGQGCTTPNRSSTGAERCLFQGQQRTGLPNRSRSPHESAARITAGGGGGGEGCSKCRCFNSQC